MWIIRPQIAHSTHPQSYPQDHFFFRGRSASHISSSEPKKRTAPFAPLSHDNKARVHGAKCRSKADRAPCAPRPRSSNVPSRPSRRPRGCRASAACRASTPRPSGSTAGLWGAAGPWAPHSLRWRVVTIVPSGAPYRAPAGVRRSTMLGSLNNPSRQEPTARQRGQIDRAQKSRCPSEHRLAVRDVVAARD